MSTRGSTIRCQHAGFRRAGAAHGGSGRPNTVKCEVHLPLAAHRRSLVFPPARSSCTTIAHSAYTGWYCTLYPANFIQGEHDLSVQFGSKAHAHSVIVNQRKSRLWRGSNGEIQPGVQRRDQAAGTMCSSHGTASYSGRQLFIIDNRTSMMGGEEGGVM